MEVGSCRAPSSIRALEMGSTGFVIRYSFTGVKVSCRDALTSRLCCRCAVQDVQAKCPQIKGTSAQIEQP